MKPRTWILSLAGAVSLLPLLATPVTAAPERGAIRQQAKQKLSALRDDLGLDATQKKQIREVLSGHKQELLAQWRTGKAARDGMREAVKEHGSGSPQATAAAGAIGEASKKRALLTAAIATEIKPILTPEQVKKLEAARADFESWLQQEVFAGKS